MMGLSRVLIALAACCLGDYRRDWALAMQAEFDAARADGKELAFAFGCLIAACRELAVYEEGRFALAKHALALVVLVPVAGLAISTVLIGFPVSYLGHFGGPDLLGMSGEQGPLLSEANRAAVPALAVLVLLLAALNLRMAWLTLDGDWSGFIGVGFLSAAATATLVIVSAVVFVHPLVALAHLAVLAFQLTVALALARWGNRLSSAGLVASVH